MLEEKGIRMGILDGKVALITGAGGGLGESMARHFAAAGARLVLTDINSASVSKVAAEQHAAAIAVRHDVTDASQWAHAVSVAVDRLGGLDILINNAAAFTTGTVEACDIETFERIFHTNVASALLGIQAVTPALKQRGGGCIINMASAAGFRGMPGLTAYSTSKWALRGLTRCAAIDLAPYRIRVNCMCPGAIETPFTKVTPDYASSVTLPPIGRIGVPDDIAPMVALLASDQASFATGSEIVVDGGRGI